MRNYFLRIFLLVFAALAAATIAGAQDESQPKVLQAVPAIYPLVALSEGHAQGAVVVEVSIDSNGTVTAAQAIAGANLLRPISELSARRWLFAPANVPARRCRLTFHFTILPSGASSIERVPIFKPPYEIEIRDAPPRLELLRNSDSPRKHKFNKSPK